MRWKVGAFLGLLLAAGFSFQSCNIIHADQPGTLTLHFKHQVDSQALRTDTLIYHAPTGYRYGVSNLRYILSEFALYKDGKSLLYNSGHLIDIHDTASLTLQLNLVPEGDYDSISFRFGLSAANNHKAYLPNTVAYQSMYWPKQLGDTTDPLKDPGFHYMQYEGKYKTDDKAFPKPFNLHAGPTWGNDNSFVVSLRFPQKMHIKGDDWNVDIIMDLQEWLQNPHVFDFEHYGPAIMPNQAAQQVLRDNGATVFQLANLRDK